MKLESDLPNSVEKWQGIRHGANIGLLTTALSRALKQNPALNCGICLFLKTNTDYSLLTLVARSLKWKCDVISCKIRFME
jgi:hypothetical protein